MTCLLVVSVVCCWYNAIPEFSSNNEKKKTTVGTTRPGEASQPEFQLQIHRVRDLMLASW